MEFASTSMALASAGLVGVSSSDFAFLFSILNIFMWVKSHFPAAGKIFRGLEKKGGGERHEKSMF